MRDGMMDETDAQTNLLPALARVMRGTSILFWSLPIAMVVSIMSTLSNWTDAAWPMGMLLPPAAFGMLWVGLWLLGSFQPQERVWRVALDEAKLMGLFGLGLSPFLHWRHRAPDELYFTEAVCLLALVFALYLMALNKTLARLAAMLPDETLRMESQLFSRVNRVLLAVTSIGIVLYRLARIDEPPDLLLQLEAKVAEFRPLLFMVFVLIPVSMTMSLLWKTKESVLASVFTMKQ
ncbi:MAG: hypothetical protein QGG00_11065 [Verrucomicrobiota bacterium]|nr:hypothetical protein [Verrucomicrobiota bacterium]